MELEEIGDYPTASGLPSFEEEPLPGEITYNPYTDENSKFYGLSPNWTPTGQRPIPTIRCHRIKPDGTQCKNRGLRGTGLNGTKAVCRMHGGSIPNVKNSANAIVEAAKLQITESTPDAIITIMELMKNTTTPQAVRLKAATEVLDRAGVKGGIDINVEVTNNEAPSAKFMKKLADMRKKDEPVDEPLEDLGESDATEREA